MKSRYLFALLAIAFTIAGIVTGCQKRVPSGVAETARPPAPPPAAPSEQPPATPDTAATAATATEQPAPPATSTNWIGKPLGEFLKTIDYPTSYEMKTVPGPQATEAPGSTIFKLEDRRALKSKIQDGENWMIIDLEANVMYGYRGQANVITKIPLGDLGKNNDPNASADKEATILREEVVDGHDCWVVRTSCIGPENDVWVDKKEGLVRQVKRDAGTVSKYNYYRINEIPDSEFELPEGVEIRELKSSKGGAKRP